jgi:Amt family ammonium transporter
VVSIASILYFAIGFGLMFGESAMIVGTSGFAPGADAAVAGAPDNLPLYVFLFFQLVFAATAATIVSGAVAERVRLASFFLFTAMATAVIYPIVGHWVWGGGFLSKLGFHDFAGSTVVHAVGGAMALAGAIMVGPRIGKYDSKGRPRPLPAHSFPLAALGVLILWLGWFGFNGGSQLAAEPRAIASIIVVTNLAAAAGFLIALLHVWLRTGMLDLSMGLNGALGGLVAITAGCDVIGPAGALVIGAMAGALIVEGVMLLERRRIDDPVGAVAVHGIGGVFGTLAVGVFAAEGGLLAGGGFKLLGIQALGAGAAVAFAGGSAFAVWGVLELLPGGIRVDQEHEIDGLDLAECGASAYGDDPVEVMVSAGPAHAATRAATPAT